MYDNAKDTNYMKANSFIAWLTLFTALTISGVAIFYSVSGLAAIFSAAVIPIIIMGVKDLPQYCRTGFDVDNINRYLWILI